MNHHGNTLGGKVHVELDPAHTQLRRLAERRDGVLWCQAASSAMPDHTWQRMPRLRFARRGRGHAGVAMPCNALGRRLLLAVAVTLAPLLVELRGDVLAGRLVDLFHAELDLAAVVEAQNLHLHLVADLDDIAGLGDALRADLADVDEPVARTQEIHEGAEIHDLHDLAGVDHTDLGLRDDAADPVYGRLRGGGVHRGHLDGAVV